MVLMENLVNQLERYFDTKRCVQKDQLVELAETSNMAANAEKEASKRVQSLENELSELILHLCERAGEISLLTEKIARSREDLELIVRVKEKLETTHKAVLRKCKQVSFQDELV